MAIDELPGEIITFTRDEFRDRFSQDYQLFAPDAQVGPGTQPYVDGSLAADGVQVLVSDAITIGNGTNIDTTEGEWLTQTGESEGVFRLPPAGASGYVIISTAIGGSTIFQGDELTEQTSGLRYLVQATALYANEALVPVVGLDTGSETNLEANTVLRFSAPRPGCNEFATVYEDSNGNGLTGGRPVETEEEYRARVKLERANPAASGNDAEYQRVVENIKSIGIQKAFTYPAIFGPGTMGFTFTLRPNSPGASRIPNGTQLNLAAATLIGLEPGDDGVFPIQVLPAALVVAYRVRWSSSAAGWANDPYWPAYTSPKVTVKAAPAPTATSLRATTAGGPIDEPIAGQTIGLYDEANKKFVAKRIDSVSILTPGQEWDLTFSAINLASDTTYIAIAGQAISPWSESLNQLVAPTLTFVDVTGPGEMFASFVDPGLRQKRNPPNPDKYPSTVTNKIIPPILALSSIVNAVVIEPTIPYATPIGTPGAFVYLFELTDLAVYGE